MSKKTKATPKIWTSIPELEEEIKCQDNNNDGIRWRISMADFTLDKFRKIKEDDMTQDQLEALAAAQEKKETASKELTASESHLEDLHKQLVALKIEAGKINQPAEMKKQGSSQSVARLSANRSVSSIASKSKLKKKQEVLLKKEQANLTYQFHDDRRAIDDLVEEIKLELSNPAVTEEKKLNMNFELQRLELKLKQIERKRDLESDRLNKLFEIQAEEIDIDEDDEQRLDSDEEEKVKNYVMPDDNDSASHSKADDDTKSDVGSDFKSCASEKDEEGRDLIDKDMMLMKIMEKQMKILERTESTNAEKYFPEFHGDPGQWGNFKAAYERLQKNYKMNNSQAMMRLQKVIKGKARQAVEHLMANVLNVDKILETLELRYGRPEFVLDYLVEKAKTCSKPDLEKPQTIVDFGTSVDALVANIHAFNETDYLHNKQLVTELVDKLPNRMKENWYEWIEDDPTRKRNLEFFSQWMRKKVKLALLQIKPTVTSTSVAPEGKGKAKRGSGSQNAAAVEEDKKPDSAGNACIICKRKNHNIDRCWVFQKKSHDDRWQAVQSAKLCHYCLQPGHFATECDFKQECGESGCKRLHHKLLHRTENKKHNRSVSKKTEVVPHIAVPPAVAVKPEGEEVDIGTCGASVYIEGTDGPLAIVPVRVRKKLGTWKTTYALLDSGATRTLIADSLARELDLDGPRISYRYKNMGGDLKVNKNSKKVKMEISGRYKNAHSFPLTDVIAVEEIGIPPYSINIEELKKKWPHLKRMKGDNLKEVVPDVIIGGDHAYLMAHRDLLVTKIDQPVAMRTVLGWVVQGKFNSKNKVGISYHIGGLPEDDSLHALVKESFKLDDYGIKKNEKGYSVDDKIAENIMKSTAAFEDGRWTIGLLRRDPDDVMPTQESWQAAFNRLMATERRMKKDPDFAVTYKKKINEYLDKGFIRKLQPEEAAHINKKTYYISHFGVTNPNKPGKFRLVFDAAEKIRGTCLNDRLYTGPDLLCSLTSVLWNFRRHRVGICGDIEDMFHRIFIQESDRCSQRFLWRDGESSKKPDVYEMKVMIFGATSSPSCATFIKNMNADKFQDKFPVAVHATKKHMYCDDLLTGADTPTEAIKLQEEVTKLNSAGGFHLKKFLSNSVEVMDAIPVNMRQDSKKLQSLSCDDWERVLGLWWNPADDTFSFKINFHKVDVEVMNGRKPSKREMCSLLMSLFDPIGFIGNFKIQGMILLQRVWKAGVDWDEYIPDDVFDDWKVWLEDLPKIENIKILRCYSWNLSTADSIELHTFGDSSEDAYSAACYMRIQSGTEIEVAFVAAKIRVAPLKKTTIPKLELQAAILGTKLAMQVLKDLEVKVNKCFYWSDSSTVLSWLKSTSARHKEFVANRVGFIQENTNINDWNWVPTKMNVADDATRNTSVDLSSESRWLKGPDFLKLDPELWPRKDAREDEGVMATFVAAKNLGCGVADQIEESLPYFGKFSNYYRLLRATASVTAAGSHWLNKWRKTKKDTPPWEKTENGLNSNLSSTDMMEADKRIIKYVQEEAFRVARNGKQCWTSFKNLAVFEDEYGILRLKGRIDNANVEGSAKNPILLPGKHHVVDLIADAEHCKNAHTGKATVFNNLRQKYWITGGRNVVRRCFARCNSCRMARAKPVMPEMGDLPSYRLAANQPVFSFCGVDFFGPIEITIGRRHEKRWVALFTCMVTRAVYLDIASGLSADEMMMVLSRFIDTHGLPMNMYSDNATNFKAVNKDLLKMEKFNGMTWNFIPPASPHFGGAWERMVGAVKKVLKNMLQDKFPKEEVLRTALKAAENIVNSRPLTYVSPDVDDPEALTPNHFLRGEAAMACSGFMGEGVGDEAERLRSMYKKAQCYVNQFWRRWTQEVLPDLVRRTKWYDSKESVRVGDLVLMVDDLQPRNTWVKGIVTKAFPGKDGLVRVVDVTTRHRSNNTPATYRRSVAKIVPLGLRVKDSCTVPDGAHKSGAGNVGT